jgi:O-acetylhomoserine (thiol)-lyase
MGFTTKILNTPYPKTDAHNALRMPTYGNASFEFDSAEAIAGAFAGTKPAHTYSRSSNPTVDYFEKQIMAVSNAASVVAFSSGMAAISNTIFAIAQQGDEIISSNKLFGTTYSFFKTTLPRLGIKVHFVDFQNIQAIEDKISDKTRALFFETITNPQIELFNISAITELAQKHRVITISDVTTTPPYIFNSKLFNVDVAVLSSTKFISGGATAIGGLCIDNGLFDWRFNPLLAQEAAQHGSLTLMRQLRLETYRNTGACMSPQAASYFSLGLETLELRVQKSLR